MWITAAARALALWSCGRDGRRGIIDHAGIRIAGTFLAIAALGCAGPVSVAISVRGVESRRTRKLVAAGGVGAVIRRDLGNGLTASGRAVGPGGSFRPGFGGGKTGVAGVIALALVDLAAAVGAGLPLGHAVVVDVHNIDVAVRHRVVDGGGGVAAAPALVPTSVVPIVMIPSAPISAVDAAAVPVEIVIQPGSHRKTHAEGEERRVARLVGLHIDDLRIVLRHVNHLGVGRHDTNNFLLHDHCLLRGIPQITGCLSLGPKFLNGLHHVSRLNHKGLTHGGGPLQIFIHPKEHLRIAGEGFDAVVPGLRVHAGDVGLGFQKP